MDEAKKARMKVKPNVHILYNCFLKTTELKNGFGA
jgi:hypothetical protein